MLIRARVVLTRSIHQFVEVKSSSITVVLTDTGDSSGVEHWSTHLSLVSFRCLEEAPQ